MGGPSQTAHSCSDCYQRQLRASYDAGRLLMLIYITITILGDQVLGFTAIPGSGEDGEMMIPPSVIKVMALGPDFCISSVMMTMSINVTIMVSTLCSASVTVCPRLT